MNASRMLSRLLALGLLVAVLAAGWSLVAEPVIRRFAEQRESIADARLLLARLERLGAARASLEQQRDELRQRLGALGGYLPGDSETLVAADLQSRIRARFEQQGATLRSLQIMPARSEGEFGQAVTVRAQIGVELPALQAIFYAIETETPYLFIDNLDIRRRAGRRRVEEEAGTGILEVRFDVFGYMRAAS